MSTKPVEYHAGPGKKNADGSRNRPKPVHTFLDYASLEGHYIEAKEIAWGGNYYIFYKDKFELTVKMDEINSINELKQLYNFKESDISSKYNSFKNRDPGEWLESINDYNISDYEKGPLLEIWDQVIALYEFATDREVSTGTKAMAISAITYLFLPMDAIPDPTPLIGFVDDAALISYVFSKIYRELGNN